MNIHQKLIPHYVICPLDFTCQTHVPSAAAENKAKSLWLNVHPLKCHTHQPNMNIVWAQLARCKYASDE